MPKARPMQVAATVVPGRDRRSTDAADSAAVLRVEDLGIVEEVYNLTVNHPAHAFAVNGMISANCGEQWLGPYENCCLGSINLAYHVNTGADGEHVVDWEALRCTIHESTHFLDNVVSANAYVPSVPTVAEAAHRARRIGLGIMGLGDMMYRLGIRYGSEEGQEFAAQVMEFVRYHSMQKSIALAEDRGTFLAFDGSIYDPKQPDGMKWQPPTALFAHSRDWGRPQLDWNAIVHGIERYGIRNAAQTTVAPTGTIATVVGCEGYGCEPVFALGYIRHFKDGDKDVELYYTSPLFEETLNASHLSQVTGTASSSTWPPTAPARISTICRSRYAMPSSSAPTLRLKSMCSCKLPSRPLLTIPSRRRSTVPKVRRRKTSPMPICWPGKKAARA